MDRRALVFAIFAAVCFALYPLADKYDGADGWSVGDVGWAWVPVALGATYVLLAVLSALDAWSRGKLQPRPLGYDRTGGGEQASGDGTDAAEGPAPD